MANIVCFGELLLRIGSPDSEPLLHSSALQGFVGGAEANVAVALAALGHGVTMVSAIPDNVLGQACVRELQRHGVRTAAIQRVSGRLGLYFLNSGAMLRPAEVIYDRAGSAFAEIKPSAYDWPELLRGADWLHVSGITPALSQSAHDALVDALATAKRLGTRISFDCNFRPNLWAGREALAKKVLGELARQPQLLFAGVRDVAQLFGHDVGAQPPHDAFAHAARYLFDQCPDLGMIATTHRKVCGSDHHELEGYYADRTTVVASRRLTLQPIVDRIGAGDAFAAGVIHAVDRRLTPQQIVDFGTASCALKHSIRGDASPFAARDIEYVLQAELVDVRR
ncbi:MAG: sugar kinase [Pseudomonadales bacterium]|nr:sugar kinase [Pseudomonadales bacterium]